MSWPSLTYWAMQAEQNSMTYHNAEINYNAASIASLNGTETTKEIIGEVKDIVERNLLKVHSCKWIFAPLRPRNRVSKAAKVHVYDCKAAHPIEKRIYCIELLSFS